MERSYRSWTRTVDEVKPPDLPGLGAAYAPPAAPDGGFAEAVAAAIEHRIARRI